MKKTLVCVLSGSVLLAGGAAMLSASAQDRTPQPGQTTQGKVWIQNRGDSEAIPVILQNGGSAPPLRVQVEGTSTVTISPGSVVEARVTRQTWEYRTVTIPSGQDPAVLLNASGSEGWETAGVTLTDQGRTIVVMKRPNR